MHDGNTGEYPIGEVARLSRVSVRMLRHYHDIGLLVPSGRSPAGYRLYSPADLRRLQQMATCTSPTRGI